MCALPITVLAYFAYTTISYGTSVVSTVRPRMPCLASPYEAACREAECDAMSGLDDIAFIKLMNNKDFDYYCNYAEFLRREQNRRSNVTQVS